MKNTQLKSDEKQKLNEYRVSFEKDREDVLSLPISKLIDRNELSLFIDHVQEKINAPNRRVAASMFAKRYSYLLTVPTFYSFSIFDKALDLKRENLILQESIHQELWLPELCFLEQNVKIATNDKDREILRNEIITELFANHLYPLWNELSKLCKVPKLTLWENTAVYFFWIYESLLTSDLPDSIKQRAKDDFDFLLFRAEGSLFGELHNNPIAKFYSEKKLINDTELRIRKTCCLYYEMGNGQKCSICPNVC